MDGASKASRRAVLRSGAVAVGALAGVLGLAGVTEKLRGGSLAPGRQGAATIKLYGTGFSLSAPGLRRGELPRRGDNVSITGALAESPEGAVIGTFVGSVQHLDGAPSHGPYATTLMESHTFLLPDGTVVGMGSRVLGANDVFAIVGGTGAYLGATGSYTAVHNPFETGGDGTAEFTLTLNAGR